MADVPHSRGVEQERYNGPISGKKVKYPRSSGVFGVERLIKSRAGMELTLAFACLKNHASVSASFRSLTKIMHTTLCGWPTSRQPLASIHSVYK